MKKKSYKLSDLEVLSFVTTLDKNLQATALAGELIHDGESGGTNDCSHCCPITTLC